MILLTILTTLSVATTHKNPWGAVKTPIAKESAQIYGSYTAGCMIGGDSLPLIGTGYEVVNPSRNRYYAHPSLTQLIKDWGHWAHDNKYGKVIVGDLSQPAGGPLTGDHRSHQIGLDVDIRLQLLPQDKKIKNHNQFSSTDVVRCTQPQKTTIQYNFHAQHWPITSTHFLQKIASEKQVERVFVSAGIKKYLCEAFPDHPVWLKKIRPEWGHTGHLHVRLQCPPDMPSCEKQASISEDPTDTSKVGCTGTEYLSWFSTTKDKKILAGCFPKTPKSPTPYWQQVIVSQRFPKECSALLMPEVL